MNFTHEGRRAMTNDLPPAQTLGSFSPAICQCLRFRHDFIRKCLFSRWRRPCVSNGMKLPCKLALLLLLLPLAGCATNSGQRWTRMHGGLDKGRSLALARMECNRLTCATLRQPLQIFVLNTPRLVAYSWPNGRIYLSRALVKALPPTELAAAIAHEMGHLINGGNVHTIRALRGTNAPADVEMAADATGCRVLKAAKISRWNMVHMLRTVARRIHNPAVQAAMVKRAEVIAAKLK